MKTETAHKIIEIIRKNGQARPHDLLESLEITPAAIHRHLKKLLSTGVLKRVGTPPHVFYTLVDSGPLAGTQDQIESVKRKFLEQNYLYITPVGQMLSGVDGFYAWAKSVREEKRFPALVDEYIQVRKEADQFLSHGVIDATARFRVIFKETELDKIFYTDFYSLPKFGKTKLGQLVLHGKQAQDKKIIQNLADQCKPALLFLCEKYDIDSLVYVPHSLPRKIPFLKIFAQRLRLPYSKIEMIKAYTGEIPIAQKSLSRLEERIQNATETLMLKDPQLSFKRTLIIDDAVGSGATLNAIAKKLKAKGVKQVYGFAIVGSYKGFEVIKEV